jgi:formate hydrogenlyase transcriptional activator
VAQGISKPLDGESMYRLLLQVAEAANAERDLTGVLEAVVGALEGALPVDGAAVVTIDGEHLNPHAIFVRGVERREGESFTDVLARSLDIPPGELSEAVRHPPVLPGSATEFVGAGDRAYVVEDLGREQRFPEDRRMHELGIRSAIRVPLKLHERLIGSLALARRSAGPFDRREVALVEALARPVAAAVANALAFDEIRRLRDQLHEENLALREELDERSMFEEIVGSSAGLKRVLRQIERVAGTDTSVLITGETGTGKELVARAIHRRSGRAERALVTVNCAALPTSLLASELFGHEKGAFTGAVSRRLGRFELADGGTLFLDEIGELPQEVQVALLRILQEGEFERVGGMQHLRTDARVIAATNRDLEKEVAAGRFREDLYYRLNVFPIEVPPLRERREDIPVLVEYFASRYGARIGHDIRRIDRRSLERCQAYDWPGNIRELQNVIERATILAEGDVLTIEAAMLAGRLGEGSVSDTALPRDLESHERQRIESALAVSRGQVAGHGGAAARLGVPATTLESKIKRLGINKYRYKARGEGRGARGKGQGARNE